ncbi:hypothetical protein J6590_072277 [Homalodisca vitripennis]|nr:hypothetical protein J6590_072277 [Homalodisca vitripennis]
MAEEAILDEAETPSFWGCTWTGNRPGAINSIESCQNSFEIKTRESCNIAFEELRFLTLASLCILDEHKTWEIVYEVKWFNVSAIENVRRRRINQCRSWLLLGWVTAEWSCPCKQPACPAIGGGSEVTFKPQSAYLFLMSHLQPRPATPPLQAGYRLTFYPHLHTIDNSQPCTSNPTSSSSQTFPRTGTNAKLFRPPTPPVPVDCKLNSSQLSVSHSTTSRDTRF